MNLQFEKFNGNAEELPAYIERLDCYFEANNVDDKKKSSILLTVLGSEAYTILRNLVAPDLPATKTYTELCKFLTNYYTPKINIVAARFNFYSRKQLGHETIGQYTNTLRQLASKCDFKTFLNDALRDQLIIGLSSGAIKGNCYLN